MRLDIASRLANRGTMVISALLIAFAIAFIYQHSVLGAMQYVIAFAFYLAVMVAAIPLPSLRAAGSRYDATSWLALVFALCYAGNAVYVGRWQQVLLLAIAGATLGLIVGAVAARQQREPQQHPG